MLKAHLAFMIDVLLACTEKYTVSPPTRVTHVVVVLYTCSLTMQY